MCKKGNIFNKTTVYVVVFHYFIKLIYCKENIMCLIDVCVVDIYMKNGVKFQLGKHDKGRWIRFKKLNKRICGG